MVTKFQLDELVQRCNACIREWGHPESFAEGSKQQVMWDALNALCACAGLVDRAPDGYAYRYAWHDGSPVLRFNNGQAVNGGKPIESVPYWLGAPPMQPNAELSRDEPRSGEESA